MFNYIGEVVYVPNRTSLASSAQMTLFRQRFPRFTIPSLDSYYVYIPAISPEPLEVEILSTPGFAVHYEVGTAVVVIEVENASSFDYMIIGTPQTVTAILQLLQLDVETLRAKNGTLAEEMSLANKMTVKLLLDTVDNLQNAVTRLQNYVNNLQNQVNNLQNQVDNLQNAVTARYLITGAILVNEKSEIYYTVTGEFTGHPLDNVILSLISGSVKYEFNGVPECDPKARTFMIKVKVTATPQQAAYIAAKPLAPECKTSNITIADNIAVTQRGFTVNNISYYLQANNTVAVARVV